MSVLNYLIDKQNTNSLNAIEIIWNHLANKIDTSFILTAPSVHCRYPK